MASSSGNSSGTTTSTATATARGNLLLRNSSSEEDLQQHLMDERKRKRMESNRESARRSRMRKQKHLDELMAEVAVLRKENSQILNTVHLTTKQCLNVEAENSVLKAQLAELNNRLDSLNEILNYMNNSSSSSTPATGFGGPDAAGPAVIDMMVGADGFLGNHWNLGYNVNQPIMASADYHLFGY